MTLDEGAENTISNKFPAAFQNRSFSYHIDIESKLNDLLIAKIMNEKSGVVNIVERKGLNLYHPFINRILERHTISSYCVNRSESYTVVKKISRDLSLILDIKFFLRIRKKGYLLTDAVDEGKDIRDIDEILKHDNINLSLVCGYVCKDKNLGQLKARYPNVTFEFVHRSETDDAYWNEITHLVQLSHTRMEPLDRDHCFHVYRFKRELTNPQSLEIFVNFFRNSIGIPCIFEKDTIKPFDERIESYTAYFDDVDLSPLYNKLQMLQSPNFSIIAFYFRLKFDVDRGLVRILPYFEVDVDMKKLVADEFFCSKLPHLCCPKKNLLKSRLNTRCVQCIENNLAYVLLNSIEAQFSNDPLTKGYRMSLVANHYPCSSF
ncbi:hypothetical protein [Methanoregula sp.]|jgi:hypothetical protein|uniref:hypothetical protein n=1 Tax=Methanoregula sp. TaxID=2052170 RepID=UPI003C29DD99